MGGIEIALVFVVFAAAIGAAAYGKKRRTGVLDELAGWLRGSSHSNVATGTCGGAAIAFRFETRGSGSNAEHWTEIDVDIPTAYPFTLNVRRHAWRDRSKIKNGEMVDVDTGHGRFDDAFLIEGAPTDIVRALFDDALLRTLLEAETHVELISHREEKRAFLRFATRHWALDVIAARAMIEGVAQIPRRLREVYAAADREVATELVGGPYRPQASDRPAREVAARREHEVARVDLLRAARSSWAAAPIVGVLIAVLFACLVALALR